MSGVFAVTRSKQDPDIRLLADRMTTAMCHRDWFVAESFVDPAQRVVLGRIGIGIFNREPQPLWNAARDVAVVWAGELYESAASEGRDARTVGQVALDRYASAGEGFAATLNGAFVIAIWDARHRRLVITNDRFGLYPLFYSCRAGRFVCAPEMKGVLADASVPRTIDRVALAQYMRFQHLLGARTFFEGIELLPAASVLCCDVDTGRCVTRPYWTFDEIGHRPDASFDDTVEEVGMRLRRAVRRLSSDAYRPGVFLSGGLDSRTILGLVETRPVASLTYGRAGSRDVHYARRIARAVGSEHHWFAFPDGRWVQDHVAAHLELTEGFHSWIHAHGMSTLAAARGLMDVNLTGWDGGTVMGHEESFDPLQVEAVDDTALALRLFHRFNQDFTWPSLTEAEEALLYQEPLRDQLRGLAFASFREELAPFLAYRRDVRNEYFYIRNHCRRLTQNLVVFTRSHVEVRFPFFDYALFDALYAVPTAVRGHQRLYRAVIRRETPRLSRIPYDHDERLPTDRSLLRALHALPRRVMGQFNRRVAPLFHERATLYADYDSYLRHELRPWAEHILFDRRTADRGIFDPAFLRTLLDRHLSAREVGMIGKIAPIISYEMMLRRFLD